VGKAKRLALRFKDEYGREIPNWTIYLAIGLLIYLILRFLATGNLPLPNEGFIS